MSKPTPRTSDAPAPQSAAPPPPSTATGEHHLIHANSSHLIDLNSPSAPLLLPQSMSKNTFYISPVANPDLVLALFIPGHQLYSGHTEKEQENLAAQAASGVVHAATGVARFFGSVSNTVTSTAASTIGVKNHAEFNKPKLRLVERGILAGQDAPANAATLFLNQRWMLSKEDGCIYSCVEEKDGTHYRLGGVKNQMLRVQSKDTAGLLDGSRIGTPGGVSANATGNGSTKNDKMMDPPSVTRESSISSASASVSSTQHSALGLSSHHLATTPNANIISVTTANGGTVFCPLRWQVASKKPITTDALKQNISINSIHVVIEDLDTATSLKLPSLPSLGSKKPATASSPNDGVADSTRLLIIKNICCGNLECELEKIDIGSGCSFKGKEEAEVTMNAPGTTTPSSASSSKDSHAASPPTLESTHQNNGLNLKQIWRIESDFSIWLSTLSRSVSTEYNLTRKLQKVEEQRRRIRDETPDPELHIPMKLTIDYEYQLVWSTEGTKAKEEASIWRPKFPAASMNYTYFGDYMHNSLKPPTKKETLVVSSSSNGATLHKGVVRPIDFELIYTKTKGKTGNLYVWLPIAPPGIDALPLGHVTTSGKKEEKPHINCGVVCVLREYLRDTGHALSNPIWLDNGIGGGVPGSFWAAKHSFTFFCSGGSHNPPTGSYYALLDPAGVPEKCPLLRPIETQNVQWEPVWDDKGTLAKQDMSVWRPQVEKAYVRFGDLVVRGYAAPTSLAVVAKDHPAFKRPKGYVRLTKFYRGTRKCYVYQPIVPDENYVALGLIVMPTKEEVPSNDLIRCVHKEALIPLGVLKQMWLEHHHGMINTLTLGVTNFINLSKDGVVNMLWKNRSLSTFLIRQNTHARPSGLVYRLTMTEGELSATVQLLEVHARWVLESFYTTLNQVESILVESKYKRLSMSPRQVATIFQSIKGIKKYLNESDGDSSAFSLSPDFVKYLHEYESQRLRVIYSSLKRYLYETICEDIKDHDTTLELLDDNWVLLQEMTDVNKLYDKIEDWVPKIEGRFQTQAKSLVSLVMDEHIGKEIFERFLEEFPPRIPGGMDDEEDDDDDSVSTNVKPGRSGSTSSSTSSTAAGAASPSGLKSPADPETAELQRMETKVTLEKLSKFSSELDSVIGITDEMSIRKLYLEYYGNYLRHTFEQEFPIRGSTARSASTKQKLGMSSILSIVSWITSYIELVSHDLLEDDKAVSCEILEKWEDLVDRFMDVHDEHAKEKILNWISNIIRQEEHAPVELIEGADSIDSKEKNDYFYYTSGPSDLFLNINTLFDAQSANLTGRPLARIGLMYIHVIVYFQSVQSEYYQHLYALKDNTSYRTVKGDQPVQDVNHAGSLQKPFAFILGQINNIRLYQSNCEELGEKVIGRLEKEGVDDEMIASIEDAFSTTNEEFATMGLGATDILIRYINQHLDSALSQLFTEKTWYGDKEYFQTAILDELDEMVSYFIPNIEQGIFSQHLLRETLKHVVRMYEHMFLINARVNGVSMSVAGIAERIRSDRQKLITYAESIKRWNILSCVEKQLRQLEIIAEFLTADVDFLKLQVAEVVKVFSNSNGGNASPGGTNNGSNSNSSNNNNNEFTPGRILSVLLSLRSDVCTEDRKLWLSPYSAELKQYEEQKKHLQHTNSASKLAHMLSNKPLPAITTNLTANQNSSIGSIPYGLEIQLNKGTDLVVKDSTTSDPYVVIMLLGGNSNTAAKHLDKVVSRTIDKTLNPIWNEVFSSFHPSSVSSFSKIRFEVWDKDLIGKDFMGYCEVTLEEIRNKQLLERKAGISLTKVQEDYTQTPIAFHMKLLPREGRQNSGSDKVSGFIDFKIKYYKLSGSVTPSSASVSTPSVSSSSIGKKSIPEHDEIDFGLDDAGQTGSKRPKSDSNAGTTSGSPPATSSSSSTAATPSVPQPEQCSSTQVIGAIERGSAWNSIVGTIKLTRGGVSGNTLKPPTGTNADGTPAKPRKRPSLMGGKGGKGIAGLKSVKFDKAGAGSAAPDAVTVTAPAKLAEDEDEEEGSPSDKEKQAALDASSSPRKTKKLKKTKNEKTDFFGIFSI